MSNKQTTVRDLKAGAFFTLRPVEFPRESQVFIRREYDRAERKYWAQRFDDIGAGKYLKPTTPVYTDFIF